MAEGTVRWFDDARGHGLIVPDGGRGAGSPFAGRDVRVNRRDIQTNGHKSLEPGERVSFDIQLDSSVKEGARAVKVTQLGDFAPVPEVSYRPVADMPMWLGCCIGLLAAAALVAYGVWLLRTVLADIDW